MRRITAVILALLLAVSAACCGVDSLEDYKRAAEKTDQVEKGQTAGEFTVIMDFDTEGMTEEQIKELSYFREVSGSFSAAYDRTVKKGIYRNYLNLGGLGFDFDIHMNGSELFMRLPIIGKYMRLDKIQPETVNKNQDSGEREFIGRETIDRIKEKWLGLMKKEDVFKGRNIVVTTPDGDVKVIEYTIKLSDEQIKSFAADAADIIAGDKRLKENYEAYIVENVESLKNVPFEKLVSDVKEKLKDFTVESFSYTAYVDIDGYIVDERVEFSLKLESAGAGSMRNFSYRLDIKNWDINKEQEFDFPELTEENTVDVKGMYRKMPFPVEGLFGNKY